MHVTPAEVEQRASEDVIGGAAEEDTDADDDLHEGNAEVVGGYRCREYLGEDDHQPVAHTYAGNEISVM